MKKSSLSLRRETVRDLAITAMAGVVGGISGPNRGCNFSQRCNSFNCENSDIQYGCGGGPETDTSSYPSAAC